MYTLLTLAFALAQIVPSTADSVPTAAILPLLILTPSTIAISLLTTSVAYNFTDSAMTPTSVVPSANSTTTRTAFTPAIFSPTSSTISLTTKNIISTTTPLTTTIVTPPAPAAPPIQNTTLTTQITIEGLVTVTPVSPSAPIQTGGAISEVQGENSVEVVLGLLGAAAMFFVFA